MRRCDRVNGRTATVYDLRVLVNRVNPVRRTRCPSASGTAMMLQAATLLMLLTVSARRRTRNDWAISPAFGVWISSTISSSRQFRLAGVVVRLGRPFSTGPWWGERRCACGAADVGHVSGRATCDVSADGTTLWRAARSGRANLPIHGGRAPRCRRHQAMRSVLPHAFNWPLFVVALAVMAADRRGDC